MSYELVVDVVLRMFQCLCQCTRVFSSLLFLRELPRIQMGKPNMFPTSWSREAMRGSEPGESAVRLLKKKQVF